MEHSNENPYGIIPALIQGGLIAQSLFVIMVLMSIGSWYIMFTRWFEQRKIFAESRTINRQVWATGNLRDGVKKVDQNSPFRQIADDGIHGLDVHQGENSGGVDPSEWVILSINNSANLIAARLDRGLPFLASVGAVAPFIGLLGTVIGIYRALINIGLAGQASIDKVAGPVGEALIMTAIGLAVAIPAVMGYNYLAGRNKSIMERINLFASDVHGYLVAGVRSSRARTVAPAAAKAGAAPAAAAKK